MYKNRGFLHKTWILVTIFFVTAANSATPFSKYGMIQNVQNYSGNPFYNNNTVQVTTPRIVNATGPALKPADCERTVQNLVENVCSNYNNCKNTSLADVRPAIMIQLSTLPGYNYASSCAGYIDTIYENYQKRMLYAAPTPTTTAFPNAPVKTPTNTSEPKWKSEYNARAAELKSLQAQNAIDPTVYNTAFPTTIADLSYQDRMDLMTNSYTDYMDAKAYIPLNVVRDENKNNGTTNNSTLTECQKVYKCISQYDIAEKNAENEVMKIYPQNPLTSTIAQQLAQAYFNAGYSPCLCTTNKELLKKMNITSCDEKFKQSIKQSVIDFIKQTFNISISI